jgi:hypothetical protein
MPFFLKKRSIVSLVVVFCLLVTAMAASAILFDRQTRDATAVQHTLQVQGHLTRVLSLLQDAETGQRGYLLTGKASARLPMDWSSLTNALLGQPRQIVWRAKSIPPRPPNIAGCAQGERS